MTHMTNMIIITTTNTMDHYILIKFNFNHVQRGYATIGTCEFDTRFQVPLVWEGPRSSVINSSSIRDF